MLRTIIYMRKSSEDETEKQAESIPRQKRDLEAYLERNRLWDEIERLEVREEDIHYEDVSAKKIGRPEFSKVIDKIRKGRGVYKVLLCTELSRLSRNPTDNGTIVALLDEKDKEGNTDLKEIRTLDHTFRCNPTDKFTLSLFLSVAKFENDVRAKNTSSGMQNKKSKGATTNLAPFGYKNCWDKKGQKWVEPDGENFYLVQKVWQLYATGNYSVPEIVEEWNRMGVTLIDYKNDTRSSPSISAYRGMFRNQYYLWKVPVRDEKTKANRWIEWEHEAMISQELFDKVQLVLTRNGYKHQKVNKALSYEVILQDILRCGKSNKAMTFERKIRYTCNWCKHRFGGSSLDETKGITCPECSRILTEKAVQQREYRKFYTAPPGSKHLVVIKGEEKKRRSILTEYIERAIDAELSKIHVSEGLYELLRNRFYGLWLDKRANLEKRIKDARKTMDKLDQERLDTQDRLTRWMNTMDDLEREDLEDSITRNREKVKEQGISIETMREELDEEFERAWQLLYTLFEAKNIFSEVSDENFEPKRKLLLSMVSNIIFLDGKIIMNWKSPFDMLATGKLTKQKSQVSPEISGWSTEWLPEQDSNLWPTG